MNALFQKAVAAFLVVVLIGIPILTTAPKPAQAAFPVQETGFQLVKSTLTAISTATSAAADVSMVINQNILQPLAFVMSGRMLQSITAGVLNFVNGGTNGRNGRPQYVTDLNGHLQSVSDVQALSFIVQFGKNSNSPFAPAIASSLRNNYLQSSSLNGFFASNQCTLFGVSPDVNSYLAGNWSQGGTRAWFALTTGRNNPFYLYQRSQNALAYQVAAATSETLNELAWGQGFLSWCGDMEDGGVDLGLPQGTAGSVCKKSDGTPGVWKTPGSMIKDGLSRALGTDLDKLVAMGNVGPQINNILSNVAQVMNTLTFANALFSNGTSGGLKGYTPRNTASGYLGLNAQNVAQENGTFAVASQDMATRATQYESAWNTISGAHTAAITNLNALRNSCPAQANAAQTSLTNKIDPIATRMQQASTTIFNLRTMLNRLQTNSNSTADGAGGAFTADLQALQAMPPSLDELAQAQREAQSTGEATTATSTPLLPTGGTIYDQMDLISRNAQTLAISCGAPAQ